MNRLILNIGLNVGENEPTNQLSKTLKALHSEFSYRNILDIKVSENFGSWGKERVLMIDCETYSNSVTTVQISLRWLAEKIQQDAIAFTFNGEGHIVFNPNYTGERFAFNPDYFKVFREENKKV